MDKILIEKLQVFAHHGYYDEEQKLGQMFLLSIAAELDFSTNASSDSLKGTVSYSEIAKLAAKVMQAENYRLIETAAESVARAILSTWNQIKRVTLKLEKPSAPTGLPLACVGVEIVRGWHTVYLGLGSNLGDREGYLDLAVQRLKAAKEVRVIKVSDWIETEPYGYKEQGKFLNGCMCVKTLLSPEELLFVTQQIEQDAGREKKIHWGPRTLDIDMLLYDDRIIETEMLSVPHPDMENRLFVLEPLAQIAPWARNPATHQTVAQMLKACAQKEGVSVSD